MQFILVSDRTPRGRMSCAGCGEQLGLGYLREIPAGEVYCNCECYEHQRMAVGLAVDPRSTGRPARLMGGLYVASTPPTEAHWEPLHSR